MRLVQTTCELWRNYTYEICYLLCQVKVIIAQQYSLYCMLLYLWNKLYVIVFLWVNNNWWRMLLCRDLEIIWIMIIYFADLTIFSFIYMLVTFFNTPSWKPVGRFVMLCYSIYLSAQVAYLDQTVVSTVYLISQFKILAIDKTKV